MSKDKVYENKRVFKRLKGPTRTAQSRQSWKLPSAGTSFVAHRRLGLIIVVAIKQNDETTIEGPLTDLVTRLWFPAPDFGLVRQSNMHSSRGAMASDERNGKQVVHKYYKGLVIRREVPEVGVVWCNDHWAHAHKSDEYLFFVVINYQLYVRIN